MAKLNGDDRKKRRKKSLKAKYGLCERYPNAKVKYTSRAVAIFDRNVLRKMLPDYVIEEFKCNRGSQGKGCGRWHVGKVTEAGEYVVLNIEEEE